MYLHLGNDTLVRSVDILGIFDLDNTTVSKHSRDFLARAQKSNRVINVSMELPKSFILARDSEGELVYLSQLTVKTLMKRKSALSYLTEQS